MVINKVEISGVNTSKLPVLTASEKEELIKEIKKRKWSSKTNVYKWKSKTSFIGYTTI